jgi:hypothetical protein
LTKKVILSKYHLKDIENMQKTEICTDLLRLGIVSKSTSAELGSGGYGETHGILGNT